MEYLGKQKNTVLICTTARMKLENITLSEARHKGSYVVWSTYKEAWEQSVHRNIKHSPSDQGFQRMERNCLIGKGFYFGNTWN